MIKNLAKFANSSKPSVQNSTPSKLIVKNTPKEVLIEKVDMVEGTEIKESWKGKVFSIETNLGKYFAPTLHIHQFNLDDQNGEDGYFVQWSQMEGRKLTVWTQSDGRSPEIFWINTVEVPESDIN